MTIETKKVASANEAIEIINRLNYRHDTFQYRFTTREDHADIKYRHFDAYRENGEQDRFAIIEIVVNGKLEVVRFFNLFRDITVDLKLGDFNPDYSRYDEVINVENESATENDSKMTIGTKIAKNNTNVDTATNTVISMTQYKDLLAWAEKVSNGQLDAATQIKTHCATWLNADIDKATVIDIIKADDLNGFRNFLAQFNFAVKDDAGYIHKLYTYENGDCVLAEIPSSDIAPEAATVEAEISNAEAANVQIASGNYDIQINGERVYFTDHKITRIDAEDKLGFSFEYTLQGRKQFRHNGRVISRDGVIKIVENREIAKAQEKSFREFFIDRNHHGFFQVQISPTFADGCEHDYARYFDYYADAINFVNDAIEFCGDVPTHITIKRDKQAGKVYYHRTPDGSVHIDKPDTDFFKNYSATEIKTRIDDLNRAIKENTEFKTDCIVTGCNISRANDLLAVSKNFYEFVLHDNKPEIDERITTAKTPADDFEAKLAELKAKQSAAKEKELAAKKVYDEAGDKYVECQEATQNFLDAHADKLTEKLKAIEIKSYITLVRDNGKEHYDVFSTNELYVYAFNGFGKMFLVRCRGNELGTYDTPAQIETVIERLKAAIERGDREFTFPTIEELTKPEVDTATKENNANELPTGKITVKSGTEAWAIVGKHFPKDNLEFCRAGKGFNNEDTFCYTLDEIIYVHATCTPDNKRVECIEIVNTYEESESERNILTVYINHDAVTESAMEDVKTTEVAKDATADSLTRAMKIALEHYQDFCRAKNLTGAEYELSLYNICRKAVAELWKEEAA